MERGFWDTIQYPIIGLAPMDGVTDAPFRYIVDKYGHPDLLFTEFTNVEGLDRGAIKLLDAFVYHPTKTPTIAQVFGADPKAFYRAAFIVAELGFNGIDINMGCPDKSVVKRGAGAGLILTPDLAKSIVQHVRQGIHDWYNGMSLEQAGVYQTTLRQILAMKESYNIHPAKRILPVSVKTRTGFSEIVTVEWIKHLLETEPANITLHGRTLKQLYTGLANWDEIGKAAELAHQTKTTLLGSGDIRSVEDAVTHIKEYRTDGVLIGRAAIHNPWVFCEKQPDSAERFKAMIEHCEIFHTLLPNGHFLSLRKHLASYIKGIDGAVAKRVELMQAESVEQVKEIVNKIAP